MSVQTDRLIADRGHGLSPRQRHVLRVVARGEVFRSISGVDWWHPDDLSEPQNVGSTVQSLQRLGLVACPESPAEASVVQYDLTDAGRTLLDRMGGAS